MKIGKAARRPLTRSEDQMQAEIISLVLPGVFRSLCGGSPSAPGTAKKDFPEKERLSAAAEDAHEASLDVANPYCLCKTQSRLNALGMNSWAT